MQRRVPESSLSQIAISIVVPVMNEEQNIRPLYMKLSEQLDILEQRYEVIFVDDGSTDKTFTELKRLYDEYPDILVVIQLRRNFGKTTALVAGFSCCRGKIIFTIDGDLQDDPEEIPNFLTKLDEGYDLVSGWKFPRHDSITKKLHSRVFNSLVSVTTGVRLHDINNGFKAYRREIIDNSNFKLYSDFHRFVPVIAHWLGFRVTEIKVRHHPRRFGVSKYGTKRLIRAYLDLVNVLFLTTVLRTPLRFFGPLGVWIFFIGVLVDSYVVINCCFFSHEPIHTQPLLGLGILLMIFGVNFLLTGLQNEMIRRYAFKPSEEYSVRRKLH